MAPEKIVLISFFIICGSVLVYMGITIYNALISLRFQVDRAWSNIDVILEQRHEEIPKLVSICEQFTVYERSTLDRIVSSRQKYLSANTTLEKVTVANNISEQLRGLLAVGEAYPQLQSNAQFVQLQNRISALEGQIADRKEVFNEAVTNFNTRCLQFPTSLIAEFLGYQVMQLYKVAEGNKTAPSLKMNLPA